jgi:hypothetical protein
MKKYFLFVAITVVFASCKDTWDDEDKKMFYQSCMDAAKSEGHNEIQAKPYCDCLMEQMIKKYPNESDALEHMDSIKTDPALQQCKELLK